MPLQWFYQTLTIFGTVCEVDPEGLAFSLKARSGDTFRVFVGASTEYRVIANLDNLDRDRVAPPEGEREPDASTSDEDRARYALRKYVQLERPLSVTGVFQEHLNESRMEARAVQLLHSDPHAYVFEETHWWVVQASQMADRILDHLFDAKRNYTLEDFSKLYRTQLNILGQPTDDVVQECAVLSRLIYDLSSAYMLTGSERYFLAAKAAVDYQCQAFRSLSHDAQCCFWAYGRRRLGQGERGENLIVPSQGPDDSGTIPLYEQIYALAGLTQYYRITLDWEVLEDIRRTIESFQEYFLDSAEAKGRGFAGTGGYYSHLDPVTMRPDSRSLGANSSQKNWNSIGDHIPAYLVNLLLALDPLPLGNARSMLDELLETCWNILEETSSLIVAKFPDQDSDFVNERFHADWTPIHDYRWQKNRAVVGHNLKISWNLTRVYYYFQTRAKRLRDSGHAQHARDYEARAKAALALAEKLAKRMGEVGLDQVRGGVFDCVERKPSNSMPTQFAWRPTKDFWQQEQGILAYLILYGATREPLYLRLARECSAFWNTFFLDRERQGYFFRVSEDGLPIIEGEYGRKGGHAIGYHAFELAYLAHVYTRSFVVDEDSGFSLYFKVFPSTDQTSINVLPDFMPPGKLEVVRVRANGVDVTKDRKPANPNDFQISLIDLETSSREGDSTSGCIDLVVEFRVATNRPSSVG